MARRKKIDKTRPQVTIAYRCEMCGQIFARCHPKDPAVLCQKCRKKENNESRS